MIKSNGPFFKSITVVNKYVEAFDFGKDYLMVQIPSIENYKTKIFTRTIVYAKLAINLFEDGFKRRSQ